MCPSLPPWVKDLSPSLFPIVQTCVLLCDRGACDGKAYISPEGWREVKARALPHLRAQAFNGSLGDSDVPIREERYNAGECAAAGP